MIRGTKPMDMRKGVNLLIRCLIAWLGCIIIIHVITTRIEIGCDGFFYTLLIGIFTFVAMYLMYQHNIKKTMLAIFAPIGILSLISVGIWINGIKAITKDFITMLRYYDSTNFSMVKKDFVVDMTFAKFYTILLFLVIMAAVICLIVNYCPSMIAGMVIELPLFVFLMCFNVIPSVASFALLLIFIFGLSALEKNNENFAPPLIMIFISGLVCFIVIGFFPKDNYKKPEVLVSMNQYLIKNYSKLFQFGYSNQIVASGGLSNGELGNVDAIEYNHEPLVTVTTIKSEHSQYFPEFYGEIYDNNSWSVAPDDEDVTKAVMDMMDVNPSMQNAFTVYKYKKVFSKYVAKLVYHNNERNSTKHIYVNREKNYTFFKQLADQTEIYDESECDNNSIMTQQTYAEYEQENRRYIYNRYLQVPTYVRGVVDSIFGNQSLQTVKQKQDYLKYVREYLSNEYQYSFEPGRVPANEDFVTNFLTKNKKGYCTYFATAAVMIYRSAGIPARYVEGFVLPSAVQPNEDAGTQTELRYDANGNVEEYNYQTYNFSLDDSYAHAWVEVYMDGYGWVVQEVTPATEENVVLAQVESSNKREEMDRLDSSEMQGDIQSPDEMQQQTETKDQSNGGNASQKDTTMSDDSEENPISQTGEQESDFKGDLDVEKDRNDADRGQEQQTNSKKRSNAEFMHGTVTTLKYLSIILIVIIFVVLPAVIIIRYRDNQRKKQRLYALVNPDRQQILRMYQELERLLNRTCYYKPDSMDYEQYAEKLLVMEKFFHQYQIDQVIDIIIRTRFSKDVKLTAEELALLKYAIPNLRTCVYMKLKWYQKPIYRYIYLLY